MSDKLRMVQYKHGFCTMMNTHPQHPFQVVDDGAWVDYWCFGDVPEDESLIGTPVVLLVDDSCWCQSPEQLNARMKAAIGHILNEVNGHVHELSEEDTWQDRWGKTQSRNIVPVDQLFHRLDEMQHEDQEVEASDDDDE